METKRFLHILKPSGTVYSGESQYTIREVFSLKKQSCFYSICLLTAFVLWTAAVRLVDVQAIGPVGSFVGFAELNSFVHGLTGVHLGLYLLTDWLSLIPVICVLGFALLGLRQWIRRKSLFRVDRSILVLGGFYLLTGAAYLFFEKCIINFRPVLIDRILEASYPSSTTMLVICVMSTTGLQLQERILNPRLRKGIRVLIAAFTLFMVMGRLISGVHWITDIIGGILLSLGLVMLYAWLTAKKETA